jgi:hypothetical protein
MLQRKLEALYPNPNLVKRFHESQQYAASSRQIPKHLNLGFNRSNGVAAFLQLRFR